MKKIVSIFLAVLLSLSIFVLPTFAAEISESTTIEETTSAVAENTDKKVPLAERKLEAPSNLVYSVNQNEVYDSYYIAYFVSEEIAEIMAEEKLKDENSNEKVTVYIQTDWKVNDGKWNYEYDWNTLSSQGLSIEVDSVATRDELFSTFSSFHCKILGIEFANKGNNFDFENNTLTMKSRYYVEIVTNEGTKDETVKVNLSEWSNEYKVTNKLTYDISNVTTELAIDNDNLVFDKKLKETPYITFKLKWTDDVKNAILNILSIDNRLMSIVCEKQKGNSEWIGCSDLVNDITDYSYDEFKILIPETEVMSDAPIRYRMTLSYTPPTNSSIKEYRAISSKELTYDYLELVNEKEEVTNPVEDPVVDEDNNLLTYILIGVTGITVIGVVVFVVIKKKNSVTDDEEDYTNDVVDEPSDDETENLDNV